MTVQAVIQFHKFILQITFSLGCMLAMSACFWFYVQDIKGRNVVYVTAVIMGCGGSIMLVTSLSLIAGLIGHDKVALQFIKEAFILVVSST